MLLSSRLREKLNSENKKYRCLLLLIQFFYIMNFIHLNNNSIYFQKSLLYMKSESIFHHI